MAKRDESFKPLPPTPPARPSRFKPVLPRSTVVIPCSLPLKEDFDDIMTQRDRPQGKKVAISDELPLSQAEEEEEENRSNDAEMDEQLFNDQNPAEKSFPDRPPTPFATKNTKKNKQRKRKICETNNNTGDWSQKLRVHPNNLHQKARIQGLLDCLSFKILGHDSDPCRPTYDYALDTEETLLELSYQIRNLKELNDVSHAGIQSLITDARENANVSKQLKELEEKTEQELTFLHECSINDYSRLQKACDAIVALWKKVCSQQETCNALADLQKKVLSQQKTIEGLLEREAKTKRKKRKTMAFQLTVPHDWIAFNGDSKYFSEEEEEEEGYVRDE